MPPVPSSDTLLHPEDRDSITESWQNLAWSPWVPFDAAKEFWYIPREPGIYRIKPVGEDFLMYIGETGRTLSDRINELRLTLKRTNLMPWNDPHPAAPALWAYRDERGYAYECSAVPLDASTAGRKGMESFLLYTYRQERGESPLCSFGRFHPRYRMSTNRKEGRRGGRLDDAHKDNPFGWPGIAPLRPEGKPGDADWMGLAWTARQPLTEETIRKIPAGAGLYLLTDRSLDEVVFIGQSADIAKRLDDHCRRIRDGREREFSYHIVGHFVPPHHLRELETDLIGNFYHQNKRAPELQFRSLAGY